VSDFDRVVHLAKTRLAISGILSADLPVNLGSARSQIASFVRDREDFDTQLYAQLHVLEHSVDSFELNSDIPRTPFKKVAVAVFNRLFSVGGLARHLGSTQKRANQATLAALRLMQTRLEEQDRTVAALYELVRIQSAQDDARGNLGE